MFCTTTGLSAPPMTCSKSATDGVVASGLSCWLFESCIAGTSTSRSGGDDGAAIRTLTPPIATPAVMQYRTAGRMTLSFATTWWLHDRCKDTVPENWLRITSYFSKIPTKEP